MSNWYIDASSGSDTNNGSSWDAWKTIGKAVAEALPGGVVKSGDTVHAKGIFREAITIPETVSNITFVVGNEAIVSGADILSSDPDNGH